MKTLDLTNKNVTVKECDSVPEMFVAGPVNVMRTGPLLTVTLTNVRADVTQLDGRQQHARSHRRRGVAPGDAGRDRRAADAGPRPGAAVDGAAGHVLIAGPDRSKADRSKVRSP